MRHLRPARTPSLQSGDLAGQDDVKEGRNTVCVSSQAGRAMNCGFCATGKMGLKRNLTGEEIIDQVLFFARYLRLSTLNVNNVVFMGMGEPFLNYDNTIEAIRILNDKDGFNLGYQTHFRFHLRDCAWHSQICRRKLSGKPGYFFARSDDKTRSQLMPINDTYPLAVLMKAVDDYIKKRTEK